MNSRLQRILLVLLSLAVILGSGGCGKKPTSTNVPGKSKPTAVVKPTSTVQKLPAVVILVVDVFNLPEAAVAMGEPGEGCSIQGDGSCKADSDQKISACKIVKDAKGKISCALQFYQDDQMCIVTSDGMGTYVSKGASNTILGIPHGLAVFNELRNYVISSGHWQETGYAPHNAGNTLSPLFPNQSPYITALAKYTSGEKQLFIVGLDTSGYSTEHITDSISRTINLLQNGLPDENVPHITQFVINMSFGLVPCSQLNGDIPADKLAEYEAIVGNNSLRESLSGRSGNLGADKLDQAMAYLARTQMYYLDTVKLIYDEWKQDPKYKPTVDSLWNTDPLFSYVVENRANIYVGAAGNLGFEFPLAPALWNSVISVSANGIENTQPCNCLNPPLANGTNASCQKVGYSNYGEIRMDGSYNVSADVAGTSFAAPKLSYLAAKYLLQGGEMQCGRFSPPLKYAPDAKAWCNYDLPTGGVDLCPAFPTTP